ncbi:MAG: hypothetical protein IJI20_03980 [Firmicutes bacterium]|nr:hypothetical protein [Bacillota bacterium]
MENKRVIHDLDFVFPTIRNGFGRACDFTDERDPIPLFVCGKAVGDRDVHTGQINRVLDREKSIAGSGVFRQGEAHTFKIENGLRLQANAFHPEQIIRDTVLAGVFRMSAIYISTDNASGQNDRIPCGIAIFRLAAIYVSTQSASGQSDRIPCSVAFVGHGAIYASTESASGQGNRILCDFTVDALTTNYIIFYCAAGNID